MPKRIVAVVGSYRKKGIADQAVSAMLDAAKKQGASVENIFLMDQRINFCTNCRSCTQSEPEAIRGKCVQKDDMSKILKSIDEADGIVLASPLNMYTITAVMKKFIERLVVCSYWPWDSKGPKYRTKSNKKKAVLIATSAAPGPIVRFLLPDTMRMLKRTAKIFGAKPVKKLYFGLAGSSPKPKLRERQLKKASSAGETLMK